MHSGLSVLSPTCSYKVVMLNPLPGPHHCIGTARIVTDIVFRSLRAKCAASGGSLSLGELESYYAQIINSFSAGFDIFELRHHNCMDASLSTVEMPFARDKILATLLRACGEKSACAAFSVQIERSGAEWIGQFFRGFAQYVRQQIHTNIDGRLVNAYVEAATIPKIDLTIAELLRQKSVRHILLECVAVFETVDLSESLVKKVSDCVNHSIAEQKKIGTPHPCKVTEHEMHRFLALLPRQFRAALNAAPAAGHATEPPIAVA
jgi:hypothetical protein